MHEDTRVLGENCKICKCDEYENVLGQTGMGTHLNVPFVRVPDTNLCRDWISFSTPWRQRLVQPAILMKKQA